MNINLTDLVLKSKELQPKSKLKQICISQILLVLIPSLIIFLYILILTNNNFTYSLDDPYIHLALAKNIWQGNYGINMGEVSAPSSSILWPFLLAPFSIFGHAFEFVPLIINFLCLGVLAYVLSLIFEDIPYIYRQGLIFLIFISLNIYGLVFTGLEHSLQVILVALIFLPILKEKNCNPTTNAPLYQIIAMLVLPLIRYEGLAISIPMCFYLFAKGERIKATAIIVLLILFMGSFTIFLYNNNLGYLPSSILAKQTTILKNLSLNLQEYGFLSLPVIIISSILYRKNKLLSLVVLSITALHFLFGHYGWLGRYEVYYLLIIVLFCIRLALDYQLNIFPAIIALPIVFYTLFTMTRVTPLSSSNIFYMQAQMAHIARMLNEPVAVHDLGLMSLRSNQYILDLWGLGSIDALHARLANKDSGNADWISTLMAQKKVRYAFVFDDWIKNRPQSWNRVGSLELKKHAVAFSNNTVTFYALDQISSEKLRKVLESYFPQVNIEQDKITIY